MIKVLVVDDEPKLREGLKSIVPWTELGFEIVDTAANASEALEKHRQYAPDVMLVDIRMPGMDGLQLIEAIRSQDPAIHLLILSGYAEFEYAKRAITHKVDGYLLKPVDEEELRGYLLQIRKAIEQESRHAALNQIASEMSREQMIRSWLRPESQAIPESHRLAERLGLLWDHYQVALVYVHDSDESAREPDLLVKSKLVETFEEAGYGTVFSVHGCLGILLRTPVLTEGRRKELQKRLERAASLAGAAFTAAVGHRVRKFADAADSYRIARELLRDRFFYRPGELLSPDSERFGDGESAGEQMQSYEPGQVLGQLYYAVDVGHAEAQQKLLKSVALAMMRDGLSESEMKSAFVELLTGVLGKLIVHQTGLQVRTKEYSDQISAVFRQRTVYELYRHCVHFLQELNRPAGEGGSEQEMKRIIDLIQRNYSENLKLETLASIFNYNSAYLGKMFKTRTGEYFNTYLDKVRIDKAKEFLREGLKVYEVAEKVGYTNVDYFHSKFKKYVGTSPSNYRKEQKR